MSHLEEKIANLKIQNIEAIQKVTYLEEEVVNLKIQNENLDLIAQKYEKQKKSMTELPQWKAWKACKEGRDVEEEVEEVEEDGDVEEGSLDCTLRKGKKDNKFAWLGVAGTKLEEKYIIKKDGWQKDGDDLHEWERVSCYRSNGSEPDKRDLWYRGPLVDMWAQSVKTSSLSFVSFSSFFPNFIMFSFASSFSFIACSFSYLRKTNSFLVSSLFASISSHLILISSQAQCYRIS